MIIHNISVFSVTITEEWQNINDYDDKDFTLYSLWTVPGKSASMCANMCARESRCLSFTWNKFELRCKLFSKIFYTNPQLTSIGNMYFKRKDYCTSRGYIQTSALPQLPVCFRVFQSIHKHAFSASNHCQESSATLLRILNLDTLMFMGKYLKEIQVPTDVFIDGNDTAMEYDWKYSDGSDVTYLKWAPGEPTSLLCQCVERCLTLQNTILSLPYFEGMNNIECRIPRPYICQLHIYA
ncbi:CD206 [Mytilus edulis]|uniref:MRC n=1 Tax=Mytilus edulis TaxID=6550 RepID=A0A8S3ULW3_MYTED|nr:CD206 [Mytilus edulis]